MKKFALLGVAGFVAPRHLNAIKETGNQLIAAMDKSDSVGILDHYFPQADFFLELERLDRFLDRYKSEQDGIDYLSVCTPNHLHDAHVRFGLKHHAHVVCEKPLVLNPWNIDPLFRLQEECGKKVFNILQLRLHPEIVRLKKRIEQTHSQEKFEVDLAYITPRGHWYHHSWKGDITKSGGIATNIGIHFFDALVWIFGSVQNIVVHLHDEERAAGYLELEKARVRWYLSINASDLPTDRRLHSSHSLRLLRVNEDDIDFTTGFTDLHTESYQAIIEGSGFELLEALPSIELTHRIRTQTAVGKKGDVHPLAVFE